VNRVREAARVLAAEIETLSGSFGRPLKVDPAEVMDRSDSIALRPPGRCSPNRSCRLFRAGDGWIAVSLPRPTDLELIPAWIGCAVEGDAWSAVGAAARARPWRDLADGARLLGLAVAGVGETRADSLQAPLLRMAQGRAGRRGSLLKVLDLSSLWAGPLCGAILAGAGLSVTKLESRSRPDTGRNMPALFERLNGAKAQARLDFADRARLAEAIAGADVVIASARPRAFEQLGVPPEAMFARNPGLVWVAVTGYGWTSAPDRIGFGDDCAAAGGLVRWTQRGVPRFLGDALADPLTGLAAAAGALKALEKGGGYLVDAAMARTAAGVAAGALAEAR